MNYADMFVAVVCDGAVEVHAAGVASYATLCGLDGDDAHDSVRQKIVASSSRRVDCPQCIQIIDLSKRYREKDILRKQP